MMPNFVELKMMEHLYSQGDDGPDAPATKVGDPRGRRASVVRSQTALKHALEANSGLKSSTFAILIYAAPCLLGGKYRRMVDQFLKMEKRYHKEIKVSYVIKQLRVLKKFAKQTLGPVGYKSLK